MCEHAGQTMKGDQFKFFCLALPTEKREYFDTKDEVDCPTDNERCLAALSVYVGKMKNEVYLQHKGSLPIPQVFYNKANNVGNKNN